MLRRPTAPAVFLTAALVLAGSAAASAVVEDGSPGDDQLRGTAGDDTLRGKAGSDALRGYGGNDLLKGGPGRDYLNGSTGLDDIGGGPGNDIILAGRDSSEDRTYGQGGNDEIYVWGDDQASAGAGNDLIYATYPGPGMFIICGAGRDEVVFNQEPPAGTITTGDCEDVHVESAG